MRLTDIRAKWVIFAAGLAFFIISLGHFEGWTLGTTVMVLTIAATAATMAVGLDHVE